MDALALLCTLHADGPTTLRRLRDAGCGSLEDLGHVSAERLAELLGVSPAAARRFLREAGNLAERVGRQDLEPEEAAAPAAAPAAAVPDHTVRAPAPPTPSRGGLDRTDRQVLERVIDRWRAEEALEAANRTEAPLPEESDRLAGLRAESRISPSERPVIETLDRVVPESTGRALAPGSLDGLDERTCAILRAAGCSTIESLASDSALDLARRADLPFTLVRRLQFNAGRVASVAPEPIAAPIPPVAQPIERRSPSFAAASDADHASDDGPAGPFA
jgi:helix-hairpin-helix protein